MTLSSQVNRTLRLFLANVPKARKFISVQYLFMEECPNMETIPTVFTVEQTFGVFLVRKKKKENFASRMVNTRSIFICSQF